jgi:hypothetical protein
MALFNGQLVDGRRRVPTLAGSVGKARAPRGDDIGDRRHAVGDHVCREASAAVATSTFDPDGSRVVAAADQEDIRRLTVFTLRRRGITILEAEAGNVALELIHREQPD